MRNPDFTVEIVENYVENVKKSHFFNVKTPNFQRFLTFSTMLNVENSPLLHLARSEKSYCSLYRIFGIFPVGILA